MYTVFLLTFKLHDRLRFNYKTVKEMNGVQYVINVNAAENLPRATINMIWYLWELHGKHWNGAVFKLTPDENKQRIVTEGVDRSFSFEVAPVVAGTVTIEKNDEAANMTFTVSS